MDPTTLIPDVAVEEAGGHTALERTTSRANARMRFDLSWQSAVARHRDSFVATRLNLWRDLFPPELESSLLDKPRGHSTSHRFAPGDLLGPWREDRLVSVPIDRFDRRFTRRGYVQPRAGRWYPRGIVQGVDGVFQADRRPFRIVEVTPEHLLADLNHPLSDRSLTLDVTIESIWAQGEQHGGRCNEIAELVTADGPGMQTRWRERSTDFWSDMPFIRTDPRPDTDFYREPRLVDHIDRAAIAEIGALYGRLVPPGARMLDLMSSWHSHLPDTLETARVVGLGLNAAELTENPRLDERLVHDLNQEPRLPIDDAAFDAVICTVSVEYLVQPFEVFREVARVLRPGGLFVVTFSNRWFPPKAIQLWEGIHEFERPGLVLEYFLESGLFADLETWSLRGLPRPADDKYAGRLAQSDPVHAVWGRRV